MLQMNSFAKNCVFFSCFAIFTTLFGKFLLHLDINKRSYNHVPGECGVIPNLPGIIGLTTSLGGRLYLTTNSKEGDSNNTHLFTFYPDNLTAREIEIQGAPTKWHPNPGSISISAEPNNPNIFVFNRRTKHVDVYKTNDQSDAWKYQKTLKNQNFEGLTDLSASGPNSFYFVKTSMFSTFAFNLLERVFPVSSGEIYFARGNNAQHMLYVSSPTGIAFDSLKKSIFVSSFTRNSIYIIKIKKRNEIKTIKEFKLGCSPTSIWKDFDGSFLITCHEVRFRYLLNLMDVTSSSPSQVLRVMVPIDDEKKLAITQLYSNDGATISQANMTVRAGRSLLISNGNKILNCHL